MRYLIIIFLSATLVFGCDYLDMVPENDIQTVETIFEQRENADTWLRGLYGVMPNMITNLSNVAYFGADELAACESHRNSQWYAGAFKVSDGLEMSQDPYDNLWGSMYILIRDCNTFIENIDNVYNMTSGEKKQWKGEVLALKAYAYFELVRRYGPIVLVPKNLPADANISQLQLPRMHVDTCFKEIVNLLDEAIEYLPTSIAAGYERKPYIHLEAAHALKARALLYAASPLFNGGISPYKDMKNKDGSALFSPEDKEKWRIAAEYADETIEYLEGMGYKLISGTMTEATPLLNTMRDLESSLWAPNFQNSTEAIMIVSGINSIYQYLLPRLGTKESDPYYSSVLEGILGTNIRMVNKFYTVNGLPISEDKTWVYGDGYGMAQERDVRYTNVVPLSTDVLALHLDREPRFYATIAAPGLYWQLGPGSYNRLLVDSRRGQLFGVTQDRIISRVRQNLTGYYVKKGTRSDIRLPDYFNGISTFQQGATVYMRLAELYLIAAEAWNEYEGPNGTHRDKIFDRLNAVRERAGIPTVQESWGEYGINPNKFNEQAGLRDIIRREKTIEFMFEGHRFWDVRRWGTAIAEG